MKTLLICLFLLLPFQTMAAEDMTDVLSNEDIQLVANGLMALDGYDRVAKDGAREFTVKEFYKFGKGLRALIAQDITLTRTALRHINDANNDLVRQYSEGSDKVSDKNMVEFTAAQNKLMMLPSGVKLFKLRLDDLKLDENNIPGSVLAKIDPILIK